MAEVAFTFHLDPDKGQLLLTTEQAARWLGRGRAEFYRLLTDAPDDEAVKILTRGRSGTGKATRWNVRYVVQAAESLTGREWPVKRSA